MQIHLILLPLLLQFAAVFASPPFYWYGWNPKDGWNPATGGVSPGNSQPGNVPVVAQGGSSTTTPPSLGTGSPSNTVSNATLPSQPGGTAATNTPFPIGGGNGGGNGGGGNNGGGGGGDDDCSDDEDDDDDEGSGSGNGSGNGSGSGSGNVTTTNSTSSDSANSTSSDSVASAGSPTGKSVCDATSTIQDKGYLVMANIWSGGSGGHQCAQTLTGGTGNGIAWETDWTWDSTGIASFAMANAQGKFQCGPVSSIGSLQSTFQWDYSSTSITADVAYDIFAGGDGCICTGSHQYEIMIWLAAYGGLLPEGNAGGPVGSYSAPGGHTFDLYKGSNTANNVQTVYSFYPKGGPIKNFQGDLKPFLQHLTTVDPGVGSANLQCIQAGTEAEKGSAKFTVSDFVLDAADTGSVQTQ